MKRKLDIWAFAVAAILAIAVSAIAGKCAYDRRVRQERRTMMSTCAEDITRRLVENNDNRKDITGIYNGAAIAKARSLAQIIASDNALLKDRTRFEALAKTLDVDELHVTDSNGVIIAGLPHSFVGYRMDSKEQSRAFMPAITNRAFELVQQPMENGISNVLFQYVGVARIDKPGIVEVGFEPGRLVAATQAADVEKIARTSHISGGGRVYIKSRNLKDEPNEGGISRYTPFWKVEDGVRISALEVDCGNYRIVITMPLYGWVLADEEYYQLTMGALSLVVSMLVALFLFIVLFRGLNSFVASLIQMFAFGNVKGRILSIDRIFPVLVVVVVFFAIGMVVAWRHIDSNVHSYAREVLNRAAGDLNDDIMGCADSMLYFVGSAITEHYHTPEKAAEVDVKELMHRYGIDELNIVNRHGIVVRGDLANEGFSFNANVNTRFFLRLLDKDRYLAQPFRAAIEDPTIVRKYAGVAFPDNNGFVQIGYEKRRMAKEMDFELEGLAKGWTVGKSGFFIIARKGTGEIVSCGHPKFRRDGEIRTLSEAGFNILDGDYGERVPFEQELFGEQCLCITRLVGDYHRIVVAMPLFELQRSIRSSSMVVAVVLLVVLLAAAIVALWFVGTNRKLRQFIDDDRKRREKDMTVAKTIQVSSLPMVFRAEDRCAVSALMVTAREVGGDFYDYYNAPSGRLFILIADTSGKGIPAAMFMMKAKAIIKACIFEYANLDEAVIEANNRLSDNNDADMFVTAWLLTFDRMTGDVDFINAGHNPPLVRHADGSVEWIHTRPGLALAAMGGARYRVERMHLNPGDTLFLYTDGVTEAMNRQGELYGEARLERTLGTLNDDFIEQIRADVATFCDGAEQSDDITMVTLSRK